jgi:hypothetical protein
MVYNVCNCRACNGLYMFSPTMVRAVFAVMYQALQFEEVLYMLINTSHYSLR